MKYAIPIVIICLLIIGCNRLTKRMGGYEVHGIDISHHQKEVDWDTIARQKIDFAFIKATEGLEFKDPCFSHNWAELQRVGIKRGAYHFFHPTLPAKAQANNFIASVDMNYGDLPPVLDFEVINEVEKEKIIIRIQKWLDLIEAHYKIRPIIYTNQKLYFKYIFPHFNDYPIWMARYNTRQPILFSEEGWKFWQYGNKGQVKGVEGFVDLNVFHGNLLELEAMSLSPETAISSSLVLSEK